MTLTIQLQEVFGGLTGINHKAINPQSLSLYLQALFPAASRVKRGVPNAGNLSFHNSFDDVHLLFEVRQMHVTEICHKNVKPVKITTDNNFLFLFHQIDPTDWCALWRQWRVSHKRRRAGFPSQDAKPGGHLRGRHSPQADGHFHANLRSFKLCRSPATGRFRTHFADFGLHRPSDGRCHDWTPTRCLGRVFC